MHWNTKSKAVRIEWKKKTNQEGKDIYNQLKSKKKKLSDAGWLSRCRISRQVDEAIARSRTTEYDPPPPPARGHHCRRQHHHQHQSIQVAKEGFAEPAGQVLTKTKLRTHSDAIQHRSTLLWYRRRHSNRLFVTLSEGRD